MRILSSILCLAFRGKMKVYVETISGKRIPLYANFSHHIKEVKAFIQDKVGVPADQQKLVYAGNQLGDNHIWLLLRPEQVDHLSCG
ncbi:putative polyubiquitin [Tanacetum coccineum]